MNENKDLESTHKDYYFSKKNLVAHKENPWAHELAHTIKLGKKITGFSTNKYQLIDRKTGELSDQMHVSGIQKVVDKEEFIKFFGAGLVSAFELSKKARDVFLTIMHSYLDTNTIKSQPDQIILTYKIAKEDLDYNKSQTTFISGINELCQKGFLAPVENRNGFYWINPNMFFKGDRLRIVNEYILEGSKAHKAIKQEEQLNLLENEGE